MIEKHVFGPLSYNGELDFARADLEIYSIDTFRPSYSSLIFFNDPDVDEDNASPSRDTFAGSFSIFGHQECVGDPGHCSRWRPTRRFDMRRSSPLTPGFKRVIVTDALKQVLKQGSDVTITMIVADEPLTGRKRKREKEEKRDFDKLMSCRGMQLVTFA